MAKLAVAPKTILIIRADGREEVVPRDPAINQIKEVLGYESLDFVPIGWAKNLQNDLVMALDDLGYEFTTIEESPGHFRNVAGRAKHPVNEKATKLYHAICIPGTTHQIVGDVAIVHDNE